MKVNSLLRLSEKASSPRSLDREASPDRETLALPSSSEGRMAPKCIFQSALQPGLTLSGDALLLPIFLRAGVWMC